MRDQIVATSFANRSDRDSISVFQVGKLKRAARVFECSRFGYEDFDFFPLDDCATAVRARLCPAGIAPDSSTSAAAPWRSRKWRTILATVQLRSFIEPEYELKRFVLRVDTSNLAGGDEFDVVGVVCADCARRNQNQSEQPSMLHNEVIVAVAAVIEAVNKSEQAELPVSARSRKSREATLFRADGVALV